MTAVLGLRLGPGHDTGAALVYEKVGGGGYGGRGELACVAVAEERLSRAKHSREFPARSIRACLDEAGLAPSQLSAVVFEKTVWFHGSKWCERISPTDWPHFDQAERTFFSSIPEVPCYLINHHLAHAASAWHPTAWPLDNQPGALLVVDGRGSTWGDGKTGPGGPLHTFEKQDDNKGGSVDDDARKLVKLDHRAETQSIFVAQGREIERVEVSLRSGIGFFYAWLTECVLGFGHMHSGKSMGLAAYGDENSPHFPRLARDAMRGIDTDLTELLVRGHECGLAFKLRGSDESPTDPYFADAAAWGQRELTQCMRHMARRALEQTGARRLGLTGGVALNVVANRILRDELKAAGLLDDIFVQPAASDMGIAFGSALFGYYNVLGKRLPFQQNQVYLGPSKSMDRCAEALIAKGGVRRPDLLAHVADLLVAGKIVGWFQGRSEHGPRALGARSILCWPRPDWMKDHLNHRVKHREAFRPFAPIVQEELAGEAFDADFPVPYMLFNTSVRPDMRDKLPAVTHADGSGRLQTVARNRTPLLYDLLAEIRRRDGVGVLLNTSFNDNGEPIVESIEDAIRCFESTNIEVLVAGDAILEKSA